MDKSQKFAIWTVFAVAAVGAGIGIAELTKDAGMTTSCEEAIKKRLRSPSSYKRIELTRSERFLTEEEYKARLDRENSSDILKEMDMTSFRTKEISPKEISLFVEYDAPNGFGVPIRGHSECTYISERGADPDSYLYVSVDGKTNTEWLMQQARTAR